MVEEETITRRNTASTKVGPAPTSVDPNRIKKKAVDSLFEACNYRSEVENLTFADYFYVYCWIGWFQSVPFLFFLMAVAFYFRDEITFLPFLVLAAPIFISFFYPLEERLQPSWGLNLGKRIMHSAKKYFGLHLLFIDKKAVESTGPAMFLIEPHDVMPVSLFCFSDFLGFNKGHKNRGCISSAAFSAPLMRHVYSWASASSVSKSNVMRLMDAGISPTICPGGVQEVTMMKNGPRKECILFLRKHQGCIRLAMEYGRPIVPTFTFGQRGTWSFRILRSPLAMWVGRKLGFAPMVFFGLGGIPFAIPKPTPLTVVVGQPIEIPKYEKDKDGKLDQKAVDKYHQAVIDGFTDIFNEHKQKYGMEDTTLVIV
tara:strand:+ start:429 stop:1538 length:1110 start_codon:yes stop_codon:yes gene_type:complete